MSGADYYGNRPKILVPPDFDFLESLIQFPIESAVIWYFEFWIFLERTTIWYSSHIRLPRDMTHLAPMLFKQISGNFAIIFLPEMKRSLQIISVLENVSYDFQADFVEL